MTSKVDQLIKLTQADSLDGKAGLSEIERLAASYAANQYEGVDFEKLSSKDNSELIGSIKRDTQNFYDLLKGKKSKPQVVYVDFSEFDAFYNEKLKSFTSQELGDFKRDLLGEVENYFILRDGNGTRLNIEIVTSKPKGKSPYIWISLSSRTFFDFAYTNDDLKKRFVRNLDIDSNTETKRRLSIVRLRLESGKHLSRDQLDVKMADDSEFKGLVRDSTSQFKAYTLMKKVFEFGNPTPDEVIYFSAASYLYLLNASRDMASGRLNAPGGNNPVIANLIKDKGNLVKFAATDIAHEIGHALGLRHPRETLRDYHASHGRALYTVSALTNDIMYEANELLYRGQPLEKNVFRDFALDYFKYILGTKPKTK